MRTGSELLAAHCGEDRGRHRRRRDQPAVALDDHRPLPGQPTEHGDGGVFTWSAYWPVARLSDRRMGRTILGVARGVPRRRARRARLRCSELHASWGAPARSSDGVEAVRPVGVVFRTMMAQASTRHLFLGATVFSVAAYSVIGWLPSLLIRDDGLGTGAAGTVLALVLGVAGAVGTLLGGHARRPARQRRPGMAPQGGRHRVTAPDTRLGGRLPRDALGGYVGLPAASRGFARLLSRPDLCDGAVADQGRNRGRLSRRFSSSPSTWSGWDSDRLRSGF